MELKNVAAGLGWNEEKQIDTSNDWWEERLAVISLGWVFS
jgi:hypothetical protein